MLRKDEVKMIKAIEKVIVHSFESSLYLVSVVVDGQEHYIHDKKGDLFKRRNKIDILNLFDASKVQCTVLRHQSAFDEMIGHRYQRVDNTLEVAMSLSGNAFVSADS